jgi:hypothetical protein
MSSWFDDDDRLAEELASALDGERPPVDQAAMLMAGYDIVMTDTAEASLVHDSAVDEIAAVRSDEAGARMLAYAGDDVEIELEVVEGRIVGHVDPPTGGTVALDQPTIAGPATTEVEVDELGAFEFELRHGGSFRLRYTDASGRSIATGWVDGPHPTRG